ncbi:hypothetical protein AB0O28_19230 [Microbispora sp. NPDC088329]
MSTVTDLIVSLALRWEHLDPDHPSERAREVVERGGRRAEPTPGR